MVAVSLEEVGVEVEVEMVPELDFLSGLRP
jgi:hypothetical protein